MDRHVPAGVTYWTGIWRPGAEALSNEVQAVRHALAPGAAVVSYSAGQRSHVDWRNRTLCLSARRWITLRVLAKVVEPLGGVTHAWGALSDWHLMRSLGRRPVVFTVAFGGLAHAAAHYDAVRIFAIEAVALADPLLKAGIAPSKIRLVYPGVNLAEFTPGAVPESRFQVLFASAPARPDEFVRRGIPLLVETARACPDIDVVLLWREWGDATAAQAALAALAPPPNVRMVSRGQRTMAEVYRSAHAVACIYSHGFGKATPNSIVEGLASGRPAIVARSCGIAELVAAAGAGYAIDPTVDAARAAVRALQHDWHGHSARARALATQHFGLEQFVSAYRRAYVDARRH
jgi:glycosyltransferase involved in cell wall biosynthesis